MYSIRFFRDDVGGEPVREYLDTLPTNQKMKIDAYLQVLSKNGPNLRRPYADNLGRGLGLWELRPGRHRILYFFHDREIIILSHAFLKKTWEIPKRDVAIAFRRKQIFERRNSV